MGITFADNFHDFRRFANKINAPNIDSVYINSTGHFGYTAIGRNAIR